MRRHRDWRDSLSATAATAVRAANSGHLVCAYVARSCAAVGAIELMLSLGFTPTCCLRGCWCSGRSGLWRMLRSHCKATIQSSDASRTLSDDYTAGLCPARAG